MPWGACTPASGGGLAGPAGGRSAVCALALAFGLAFVSFGAWVGLEQLHLKGLWSTLNDQANYVSAARHLAAGEGLTSDLVYPSTLLQEYDRGYLYMPGHAVLLALSFALFGESAASAVLPSLLAYAVCLSGLYVCGRRLVGPETGVAAALLFAGLPVFTLYAFTAMAELTFLAAGIAAFWAFLVLPSRARPWAAPVLVLVPFLFRETGALWILPMCVLTVLGGDRRERWPVPLAMLLATVLLLAGVLRLEWLSDRPSLWSQHLFAQGEAEKYLSAFVVEERATDLGAYAAAVLSLTAANLASWADALFDSDFEAANLAVLLGLPLVGALLAWRSVRLRPLVVAWLLPAVAIVFLTTTLYSVQKMIALRQLLMPMLLALLVLGAVLAELWAAMTPRARLVFVSVSLCTSFALLAAGAMRVRGEDQAQLAAAELLRELPDPGPGIVVTSECATYVYEYPLRGCSFVPRDAATLRLLDDRRDVRAALLPLNVAMELEAELREVGLAFRPPLLAVPARLDRRATHYAVFEKVHLEARVLGSTSP